MSVKPTLSLSTPVTANFPPSVSEARSAVSLPSALSDKTPLSAVSRSSAFRDPLFSSGLPSAGLPSAGPFSATLKFENDLQKTPITPPVAYLDFLKSMSLVSPSLASPPQTGKSVLNRTSTTSSIGSNASNASSTKSAGSTNSADSTTSTISESSAKSDESEKGKSVQIDSAPSTARSDVSCECPQEDKSGASAKEEGKTGGEKAAQDRDGPKSPTPAPINTKLPPTPRGSNPPLSAPAAGPTDFPSMKLPASPAVSNSGLYSPRSPLSAASVHSPFDWESAMKPRRFTETSGSACKRPAQSESPPTPKGPSTPTHTKRESRSSIRHIREVVTRTVTYTPRMAPAPKGKRRKIDSDTAVES